MRENADGLFDASNPLEIRSPWKQISMEQLEQVAFIVAMTVRHWAGL
jgi:hypothetical protein